MKVISVCRLRIAAVVALIMIGLIYSVSPACARHRHRSGRGDNRPYIYQDAKLWWFNGATPANYHTTTNLTLMNRPAGIPIRWAIKPGADKINWNTNDTTTTTVAVKTVGASAPASSIQKDITITVVNSETGKVICQGDTVVLTPDHLDPVAPTPNDDKSLFPNPGYRTLITYEIMNQFNQNLPREIPLNEHWDIPADVDEHGNITEPGIKAEGIYVDHNNWGIRSEYQPNGPRGGSITDPKWPGLTLLQDKVAVGWDLTDPNAVPLDPVPVDYRSSDKGIPVDHFTGTWNIGDTETGRGKQVKSSLWGSQYDCLWHRYLGCGRHE